MHSRSNVERLRLKAGRGAAACALAVVPTLGSAWSVAAPAGSSPPSMVPPPPAAKSAPPTPRVLPFRDATAVIVDNPSQEYTAAAGETKHTFTFRVTNRSNDGVMIERIRTTCGCSVAQMPAQPWTLAPGGTGEFAITMDFTGKTGILTKAATIETPAGNKRVNFSVRIPAVENSIGTGLDDRRTRNIELAAADRQAVFKGECASCHAAPTVGLTGKPLYAAACGICHEAEHRASMVPNLRMLPFATNQDFWKLIATHGKPGTLMPAFAQSEGGPLTETQIDSIAGYLLQVYSPGHPAPPDPTQAAPGKD